MILTTLIAVILCCRPLARGGKSQQGPQAQPGAGDEVCLWLQIFGRREHYVLVCFVVLLEGIYEGLLWYESSLTSKIQFRQSDMLTCQWDCKPTR